MGRWDDIDTDFSNLVGKTLKLAKKVDDERMEFEDSEGNTYVMYHNQDCCEHVYIDDIVGELQDLIDTPILRAEERTSNDDAKDGEESHTWTFYEIATIKGSVTIKWYGSSNGYYSESVFFVKT